jgi:hypothetical protein
MSFIPPSQEAFVQNPDGLLGKGCGLWLILKEMEASLGGFRMKARR